MATQLDDIPCQQLVKISVRTVTDEGESPDPKKIVVINPREITQLFILSSCEVVHSIAGNFRE